jgi:hypothetical protein
MKRHAPNSSDSSVAAMKLKVKDFFMAVKFCIVFYRNITAVEATLLTNVI